MLIGTGLFIILVAGTYIAWNKTLIADEGINIGHSPMVCIHIYEKSSFGPFSLIGLKGRILTYKGEYVEPIHMWGFDFWKFRIMLMTTIAKR